MPITFENIPNAMRVPLFYAELTSGGTPFNSSERLLLIGQKLSTGSAAANVPVQITGKQLVEETLFGAGSMLSDMVKAARKNSPLQEIWALPLADNAAGVAATGQVKLTTLTLPVTTATNLTVYIGGRKYTVSVTTTDTATTLGAKFLTEFAADTQANFTATNAAGVLTITAKHKGELGNSIDLRNDLYGNESALSGQVTFVAMAGGATNPVLTTALANLGDSDFLWIANPYTDAVSIAAMSAFMGDASGRWSPTSQIYGHVISAAVNTVANLSTLGNGLNDQHLSITGVYKSPTPVWDWTAALAAKAALHLSAAPELSRPLQFLKLEGIMAPAIQDRFTLTDKNTLLYDGIGTYTVARDGSVQIERMITTYKTNVQGTTDATFLDIQTLAQSQFAVRYLRNKVVSRHGRTALADDTAPAQNGVTRPRDIRNTLIAGYAELAGLSVVENQSVFEQNLVVERNATDANRIDVSLPVDVVNQLRVIALAGNINLQFAA